MKLIKSKDFNVNYLAKVVKIDHFNKHSDPEVTKLKCCVIDGYNIICGIDSQPGLYVYFPTGSCLNPDFLRFANLYRDSELNNNHEEKGMFETNGKVRAIRLRGELSEGFILPAVILENYLTSVTNINYECEENTEFDSCEHEGKTFWINKKYVIKSKRTPGQSRSPKAKTPKGLDKLVDGQFRFHYDRLCVA